MPSHKQHTHYDVALEYDTGEINHLFATMGMFVTVVMELNMLGHIFAQAHDADPFHIETLPSVGRVHILVVLGE